MLTDLKAECVQIRNIIANPKFKKLTPLDQVAYKVLLDMRKQQVALEESQLQNKK